MSWPFGGLALFFLVRLMAFVPNILQFHSLSSIDKRQLLDSFIPTVFCLLVWVGFLAAFRKAKRKAQTGMLATKREYDDKWNVLKEQPGYNACMRAFMEIHHGKEYSDRCDGAAAERQVQKLDSKGRERLRVVMGRYIHVYPAGDIVELYREAVIAQQELWKKADEWTRGGRCGKQQKGKLKDPARAIQKAFRIYGGDACKLCDLARTTITFEKWGDMETCMRKIAARHTLFRKISSKPQCRFKDYDDEDRSHDFGQKRKTAPTRHAVHKPPDGYHDIQLRVRIEGHVCEVQLHMKDERH